MSNMKGMKPYLLPTYCTFSDGTMEFDLFTVNVWLKDALSMVVPIWIHGACAFVPAGRGEIVFLFFFRFLASES